MSTTVIQKRKLYEEVELRIELDIMSGKLKEGDLLPSERDLMKSFGVGRPAVREALQSLRKRGLVSITNGERSRVTRPNVNDLLEQLSAAVQLYAADPKGLQALHDLRTFLEAGFAREAAQKATPDDILRLEALLAANKRAIGDRDEFERTDNDFHFMLAEICGNALLAQVHKSLIHWLSHQRSIVLRHPNIELISYELHEGLFKSIAARDPERAEVALRASLENVDAVYWRTKSELDTLKRIMH